MCIVILSRFVCLLSFSSSAIAMYSSVLKCFYSNFSDPEILGFVN